MFKGIGVYSNFAELSTNPIRVTEGENRGFDGVRVTESQVKVNFCRLGSVSVSIFLVPFGPQYCH